MKNSIESRIPQNAIVLKLAVSIWLMSMAVILAGSASDPSAPVAKKIPNVLEEHGHRRDDPYFWMKERENPAVIEYLKQENDY